MLSTACTSISTNDEVPLPPVYVEAMQDTTDPVTDPVTEPTGFPTTIDPDNDPSTITAIAPMVLRLGPNSQLESYSGSVKSRYTKFPPLDPRADAPLFLVKRVFTVKVTDRIINSDGTVTPSTFKTPMFFIDLFRRSADILTPILSQDTFDNFAMSWVVLEPHNIAYIEQIRTFDLERYVLQIVTLKSGEEWLVQAKFDELMSAWAYTTSRKIMRVEWTSEAP